MIEQLSPHFTLAELTHSQIAARLGITNTPSEEAVANLQALCVTVLEPLRGRLGRPIVVDSGYRSTTVNDAVGGVRHSQHTVGEAADIVVRGMAPRDLLELIRSLELPIDQCVVEFDQWVHVSHRRFGPGRGEFLRAYRESGTTRYVSI